MANIQRLLLSLVLLASTLAGQGPGPHASGNVALGLGGPLDLLRVNGSSGGPVRRVDVPTGTAIRISLDQPPTNPLSSPFAIFGAFGVSSSSFALPFGIGTMCFPPAFAAPGNPNLFVVADSLGLGLPQFAQAPVSLAPYSESFGVVNVPLTYTLQALLFENGTSLRLSNALVVSTYDASEGAVVVATSYPSSPSFPGGPLFSVFTDVCQTLTFDAPLDASSYGGPLLIGGAPLQLVGQSVGSTNGLPYFPFADQAAARQGILLYDDALGEQVQSYVLGRSVADPDVLVIDPRVPAAYERQLGIIPSLGLESVHSVRHSDHGRQRFDERRDSGATLRSGSSRFASDLRSESSARCSLWHNPHALLEHDRTPRRRDHDPWSCGGRSRSDVYRARRHHHRELQ